MCTQVVPIGISLQNILLATDFSSCSETALSYAVGMSRRYGATMYTVSVVPEEFSDVQPQDPFYLRHSAENKMANLVKSDVFQGIKHQELVKEGFITEVRSELIGRLEIGLIVLGTHGRGGIKNLVLGSVAEEIVDSAYCPVLTVGPHVSSKLEPEVRLRRILYATDSLPGAPKARLAVLSDTAVGLLMFDYVWNDMNAFGPEMTICEVATERFLGRAATIGRQGRHRR
jgi:nucleotide-binding universal stress UspA family protein